jgi:hypothetical protein
MTTSQRIRNQLPALGKPFNLLSGLRVLFSIAISIALVNAITILAQYNGYNLLYSVLTMAGFTSYRIQDLTKMEKLLPRMLA